MTQPIKTALCSFGMSGWVFHAPFISNNPAFELYSVFERSRQLAKEKYPNIISYASLEEMLKNNAIELVIVNTPNYTHYEYTKAALQAGKHVVVEKPFAITTAECDELIALAKQQGKKLSVYHNRRWDSDFKTVRQIVEQQLLGDVVEAEFHYDRYSEELSPKLHKETPGPGTGSLYDLGSHLIDQTLQLFGMPQAVFADITTMRNISQVSDYFELLLLYPSLRVRLKSSYLVKEVLPSFILHGTKGSFIKPRGDVQEARLQKHDSPTASDWGIEPETLQGILNTATRTSVPTATGNYMDYYTGLANAIRNDAPLPVTAAQGRQVIQLIEKAYQSQYEKRIIEV